MSDTIDKFIGIARLYSADGLNRLRAARVCVVGLGGVGSWTAESLARSGVGHLTLVDLDEICISNVNRQIHALASNVGHPKVSMMAERIRGINPECDVEACLEFFTGNTAERMLAAKYDFIVDAIDSVTNKCLLIAGCREKGIPIIASGAAGGRRDPTRVGVSDLAFTEHDRLLQKVRERLRKEHGFPTGRQPFGIECVYSPEPPVFPREDGSVCATKDSRSIGGTTLNCEAGLGSASFVTGAFGLIAAGRVVERLATGNRTPLPPRSVCPPDRAD